MTPQILKLALEYGPVAILRPGVNATERVKQMARDAIANPDDDPFYGFLAALEDEMPVEFGMAINTVFIGEN